MKEFLCILLGRHRNGVNGIACDIPQQACHHHRVGYVGATSFRLSEPGRFCLAER